MQDAFMFRAPAFKGSGMKLGSKKAKQNELLDALGGEVGPLEDLSAPATPSIPIPEPTTTSVVDPRGSLPTVTPERWVKSIVAKSRCLIIASLVSTL